MFKELFGKVFKRKKKEQELLRILETMENMSNGNLIKVEEKSSDPTIKGIQCAINKSVEMQEKVIADIHKLMTKLAEKDFTAKPESPEMFKGNYMQLLESGQEMLKTLNEFIKGLQEVGVNVEAGSSQIANECQNIADEASMQSEMSLEVKRSAEEIDRGTKASVESASQILQACEKTGGKVVNVQKHVNGIFEQTKEINANTERIKYVMEGISNISEEIGILALNARIEAARAGQQGAGFTVVAQEMANLNESTKAKLKETSEILNMIVDPISKLFGNVNNVQGEIEDVVVQAGSITTEVQNISKNMQIQEESVSTALKSIEKLADGNARMSDSITGVAAGSEESIATILNLDELLKEFKI